MSPARCLIHALATGRMIGPCSNFQVSLQYAAQLMFPVITVATTHAVLPYFHTPYSWRSLVLQEITTFFCGLGDQFRVQMLTRAIFTDIVLLSKSGGPYFHLPNIPLFFALNFLKPAGHVMHQQFNIQQLYALPTLYLRVLYLSENKQRLVPLTA